MRINKSSSGRNEKKGIFKLLIISFIFTTLILFSSLAEVTFFQVFESTPALTLSFVCAIGFIFGEKLGAVIGIFAGIIVYCLGGAPIPLSPILYMICGYMCGAAVGWFLSSNFPSFIVYSVIAGFFREIFSIISVALLSDNFNLWNIITDLLIPEFFAYIICVPISYYSVLLINRLFKGKNNRVKQD